VGAHAEGLTPETAAPPAQAGTGALRAQAPPDGTAQDLSAGLRRHLFIVTAALSSVLIGYMFWASSRHDSSLVVLVFLTGGFGGMLSAYRRFRLISPSQAPAEPVQALPMDAYLSPLLGAMFGVILYLVMMTGMVQGDFFPRFRGMDQQYDGLFSLFNGAGPAENKDAIKTVFWAFLAGFSERFVPDLLGRVGPRR
jgi:hypothetical protein